MRTTRVSDLESVFSKEALFRTIRRMRSKSDIDDLITHPLKRIVLTEYGSDLGKLLAAEVNAGTYRAGRAYPCRVAKRAGGYRELVFPSLVDSIVARNAIDAVEPHITKDDDNRTFCGRSHANSNRRIGDYERWFQVWRDYTSSIARACEEKGYAYVFETDVTDFYPSVDRARARAALEKRTGASSDVSAFLFHCLESWLVRPSYEQSPGLPIEPNDISRLIAHNYLKTVDGHFPKKSDQEYLRFVDDTVVFVRDKDQAEMVKRKHYDALAQIGLTPNASKTNILPTGQYEKQRHVEVNRCIDDLRQVFCESKFSTQVKRWYKRKNVQNWSRITKRLYTLAREHNSQRMRRLAINDLQRSPDLVDYVLRYLSNQMITKVELSKLLNLWRDQSIDSERLIGITGFLCNACFAYGDASKDLSNFALSRIRRDDHRPGALYARALLLLILYKHGNRGQWEKVFQWGISQQLIDSQFQHYFLYVFMGTGNVDEQILNRMRSVSDSDLELTIRICQDAKFGSLKEPHKLLDSCISCRKNELVIDARYLPFLHIVLSNNNWREKNEEWIKKQLEPRGRRKPIRDPVVKEILDRTFQQIMH